MRFSKYEETPPKAETPPSPERREFMRTAAVGAGAIAAGAMAAGMGASAVSQAQAAEVKPWWPSRWGAADEIGATNWMTPAKVLEAAKWIRDGKTYRLGQVYEAGMPLFGARVFALRLPGSPTGGPFGDNKLVYNDEFLATEIGQVGTQFDGLGHIGLQLGKDGDKSEMRYYNGFTGAEIGSTYGLNKLGVQNVKPFFTKGHLFDVAAVRGQMWDVGQEIKLADVQAAMAKQGMSESSISDGDAFFFHTGWSSLWMKNNDRYGSGEPGIGLEVAEWLVSKNACLVGADTWGVEAVPNPDPKLAFPVHAHLITKNGIHLHENLVFDALIADRKYQFVYVFTPVRIKGATGSPGEPLAVT